MRAPENYRTSSFFSWTSTEGSRTTYWLRSKSSFPVVWVTSGRRSSTHSRSGILEAWYFADATNLRGYLGRALGDIDTSRPDGIQNPKGHLKNLLADRVYTARVSEEIASQLDAEIIKQRSRGASFKGFLDAAMNGPVL